MFEQLHKEVISKGNKLTKQIITGINVTQRYGRPFYVTLVALIFLVVVLMIAVAENRLMLKSMTSKKSDEYELDDNINDENDDDSICLLSCGSARTS